MEPVALFPRRTSTRRTIFTVPVAALSAMVAFAALRGALAFGAMPATGPAVPGFETYDRTIPAFLEKWRVPGAALAVAYDGRMVFARGYGYADRDAGRLVQPDTRFRLMSISKMLTAAMILKLVEEGRLSLDDHPFALLNYPTPTYAGAQRDGRLGQICVRHLLNHSAGWVSDQADNPIVGGRGFYPTNYQRQIAERMGVAAPGTPDTMIRYMVGQPMQATPGTTFSYCAVGYLVLDRLIELKTGLTYEQAVQRFLAGANISGAAMGGSRRGELAADEAVYYDYPGAPLAASNFDGAMVAAPYAFSLPGWEGAGGWKLSAIECLRFLLAVSGQGETSALLRADTVRDMRAAKYPSNYYGYGWYERYACSAGDDQGHGGGSWGSKTWALRSADGHWHTVLLLNSLPGEAFGGSQFEADAYAALHALPANAAPADWDLTWSTLGWDGWRHRYFGDGAGIADDDPDGDGFENLIEYGAATDPLRADAVPAVDVSCAADGTKELTHRRSILEHALEWRVETSDDGRNWSAVSAAPGSRTLNEDGTWSLTVPLPQAAKARLWVRRMETGAAGTKAFDLVGLGRPIITEHPVSRTLDAGGAVTFSVAASTPEALALTYQWTHDGQPVAGATAVALRFTAVTPADAGDYAVTVANAAGTVTSRLARLVVASQVPGRLVNLSVRGTAGIGGQPLIVGFVVAGGGKQLLLRGAGPALVRFGVAAGAMSDPRLDLHQGAGAGDHVAASNDDWSAPPGDREALATLFAELGATPFEAGSADAALVTTVEGLRTVHVNGRPAGASGIVLVEAYDAGTANLPRLVNVSARNHVGAAPEVLIAGFVINGNTPKRLLVRGVGPGLVGQGVGGALVDPRLELHARFAGRDTVFATNDNWADEPGVEAAGRTVGAFPLAAGSRDAALLVTLPAGLYSAIVAGVDGGTGEGLVEVYEVE